VGALGIICLAVLIARFCENHIWYVIGGEAFVARFSLSSPWSSVPAIRAGFLIFTLFAAVALPYAVIVGWRIDRTTSVGYWSFLISAIALCVSLLGPLTCTMAKMIIYIRDMGFTHNRVMGLLYGLGGCAVIVAFLCWAIMTPRKNRGGKPIPFDDVRQPSASGFPVVGVGRPGDVGPDPGRKECVRSCHDPNETPVP